MNINDKVFIIHRATFFGNAVSSSISVIPAKVISIGHGTVVEIELESGKIAITPIPDEQIYPTVAKALEQAQITLTEKASIKQEQDEN